MIKALHMKKQLLLAVLFIYFSSASYSQPGQLDPSFGNHGIVKTDIGKDYNYSPPAATQVLPKSNGSIYVLQGNLTKRLANGSIDPNFGLYGSVPDPGFNALENAAIQPDGNIVVVGGTLEDNAASNNYSTDYAIVRYKANGQIDSSFSGDGKLTTNFSPNQSSSYDAAYAVAIQKDGKIIAAGVSNNNLSLARYNTDGSLDNTFGSQGLVKSNFKYNSNVPTTTAIALQNDGKIVVAGGFSMVRYNANGTLDNTFNGNGIHAFQGFNSIALQKDGKIVTAGLEVNVDEEGATNIAYTICRLNTDGSFDKSFSGDGKKPALETASLVLQSDGKIVTVGSVSENFLIARYNTDGSLDSSFSDDGYQPTSVGDHSAALTVAIQFDGKIVAGGSSSYGLNSALARYNTDGSLDTTFNSKSGNTVYKKTAVQKDGKAVVTGTTWNGNNFNSVIVRYNTNGSLDKTFSNDGIKTIDAVDPVAIQNDGKIVVGGRSAIIRYNTDGSLDSSFSKDGKQICNFGIASIALQSDGKIVVAGTYDTAVVNFGATTYFDFFAIARYNSDGSVDKTFNKGAVQTFQLQDNFGDDSSSYASSVAIQPNGKIMVAGMGGTDPYTFFCIARLNADGSLDSSFSDDGKETMYYNGAQSFSLALQDNGKIVTLGYFSYRGTVGIVLTRYNTDGSLDKSFNGSGSKRTDFKFYSTIEVNSVAVQSNGKIVVGGSVLLRYNNNGSQDSTFGNNGQQATPFHLNNIAISNNKLYAVGGGYLGSIARYLLDGNNTSPTVSLTAPSSNATYLAPAAHIKLSATASDRDGTISKVEFYNDTTLLHTETVAPYGFVWRNVSAGNYTITAKAYDNSGLVTTSAAVHISVVPNKAPVVSIITPANNQSYPAPATIHLAAAASDTDGRITKVEFYNGATLLRAELKAPYTFTWRNIPVGNYVITAKATDNWGAVTTSAAVNVSVHPNMAPTVSITSTNTTFIAPAIIPLMASASDADGRITKVEFYNGATLLRTERKLPYTYHWQNVAAGTYTITAVATDNYGRQTKSAPLTITVTNAMIVSSKALAENEKTSLNNTLQLKAFPNPATNVINLSTTGLTKDKQATISVISASGVVMKTIQSNSSTKTVQLNLSLLAKGVYTIKLVSGDKVMYKKFVKL